MNLKITKSLLAALLLCGATGVQAENTAANQEIHKKLTTLESSINGRLGLALLDQNGNTIISYRADERFPMCSTFKMMLAAAILKKSETTPTLLDQRITYKKEDLVSWSPVTEKHIDQGQTIAELCAATLQYSDNTAANLLLQQIGGPQALTAFARSIGDTNFRLDRTEPTLNEALPGDPRDTTTPASMATSLYKLTLKNALPTSQRETLVNWLKGNTTGTETIRAGLPPGWTVGDKTGSGAYGTTNDIAIIWPPKGEPIILAIYLTQNTQDATPRRNIIASATRLAIESLK